ncbi:MAG: efflux transporter outer membrane subunit [Planctomycetes bacterium]|nr:efflux transporter outer membrane subunit [Planctomycetota bacterium]
MTHMRRVANTALILLAVAVGAIGQGCRVVGPDYIRPETQHPDHWRSPHEALVSTDPNGLAQWWTVLQDETLNDLVAQAYASNLDVFEAYWRIQESRALRDVQTGRYAPQIDAIGSYTRARDTQNGLVQYPAGSGPGETNLHTAGLDATWEIDLFGQISRAQESAQAALESDIENYNAILVSLCAELATHYVQLRTLQQRIVFATENVERQQTTLELTQNRYQTGLSRELDVRQAELNFHNTRAEIPSLRQSETEAINRIAVLLNTYPSRLADTLEVKGAIPALPDSVQVMMPAQVIRQRPDIRRAERQLAAQTARVGMATADLYPSLTLTGSFVLEAADMAGLGDRSSRKYGFGPSLRWNLFSGNRIRSSIDAEKASVKQALARYEKSVLTAVEEVENAMVAHQQENIRLESLKQSHSASVRSVALVDLLYQNELTDFQNVLDMQRTLFVQQDKLALSQGQVILNFISLYKSLGGDWSFEQSQTETYVSQ